VCKKGDEGVRENGSMGVWEEGRYHSSALPDTHTPEHPYMFPISLAYTTAFRAEERMNSRLQDLRRYHHARSKDLDLRR